MLLPGDGNPYHSRILWWHGEDLKIDSLLGGQWGWTAGHDGCSEYPDSNFVALGAPALADPFCGGHAMLADGRMLVIGGTSQQIGEYGERKSVIFTPGSGSASGSWSPDHPMNLTRWYPTATTLRDGRALAISGQQYRQHRIFGGLRNGNAPVRQVGDSLFRFAPIAPSPYGQWDQAVLPSGNPTAAIPSPRYAHSAVDMATVPAFYGHIYFGGIDTAGVRQRDVHFLQIDQNFTGTDANYTWSRPSLVSGSQEPDPRSDHSAIVAVLGDASLHDTEMVVYGGLDGTNTVRSDVWRFHKASTPGYLWDRIITSGTAPSARYGHSAIYDQTVDSAGVLRRRMIVFGGAPTYGSAPTDKRVWELRFSDTDPNAATWSQMIETNLGSASPAPRYWNSMTQDSTPRTGPKSGESDHGALMFGGRIDTSACSDTLWKLWIFKNGTVGWKAQANAGTAPGKRARFSASYDLDQGGVSAGYPGRLYIFGGITASGNADSHVYVEDPWTPADSVTSHWQQWADLGVSLAGHTSLLDLDQLNARTAEVYNPADSSWTKQTSAYLSQQFYPPVFLVPGAASGTSRVVNVGNTTHQTYSLDIPATGQAGNWSQLSGGALDFLPQTGVMYRPGRIMIAGGAELDGAIISGKTRTLNTTGLGLSWVSNGAMVPRKAENLVLLPTGNVLAVGGNAQAGTSSGLPVYRPQMWSLISDSTGTWSDTTSSSRLAIQHTIRGYHSTAILLPDGRVLSAGGERENDNDQPAATDQRLANLFCPPYLFKSDGTTNATRPVIGGAPLSMTWGKIFTLCVSDTSYLKRACLIRPGATTHAFDQNQRYVPLSFVTASNPSRLLVTSPASPDSAPPGWYMLFITGSVDGADVPAIARWVQVRTNGGRDTCDSVLPGPISDLAPDLISSSAVYLTWTDVADDSLLAASGASAQSLGLRYSTGLINSESSWGLASFGPTPYVLPVGAARETSVTNLQGCTTYHFALRATDDNAHLSAIHPDVWAKTLCGGGGFAAQQVGGDDEASVGAAAANRGAASSAGARPSQGAGVNGVIGSQPAGGAVIVATRRAALGGWQVVARQASNSAGLGLSDSSGMFVQASDGAGGWKTVGHFAPGVNENQFALCALRDGRRVVLAGGYQLQQVAAGLHEGESDYVLASAMQGSVGNLGADFVAAGGSISLAAGDSLVLAYQPSATVFTDPGGWFAMLGRTAPTAFGSKPQHQPEPAIPLSFALRQNQPNPFTARTAIRFDLPVGAMVRLEVFDANGRRIEKLADRYFPAGYQSVTWEPGAAAKVGPGVYFYRIEAGPFRSRRKAVLLP